MYVKVETSAWQMSGQGGTCCYHQWSYRFSALLERLLERSAHGPEQILLIERMASPNLSLVQELQLLLTCFQGLGSSYPPPFIQFKRKSFFPRSTA